MLTRCVEEWNVRDRLFQFYEIDSNFKVTCDRLRRHYGIPHPPPFGVSRKTINIPGCGLARLWKVKQKKNASDQCKREPKCTREWKVTGQTSSVADAVPLASCKINFAMRAQSTDNPKSHRKTKLRWISVINITRKSVSFYNKKRYNRY